MVKEILESEYNLMQAPMAGVTTPKLVSSVVNAGAFGTLAAGDVTPDVLEQWIDAVREETDRSFGVNFFVPRAFEVDSDTLSQAKEKLKPLYETAGIEEEGKKAVDFKSVEDNFYKQVQLCLDKNITIFSFIFGIPPASVISDIKQSNGVIIATATTPDEAEALEKAGADIITAQGESAGGHRGSFLKPVEESLIDTYTLVSEIKKCVSIPVVAAGGIMTKEDIKRMMTICEGVVLGTAFIPSFESGASKIHKKMIIEGNRQTKLTRAFTGRHARAIENDILHEIEALNAIVEYPVQRGLTAGLQQYGKDNDNEAYAMMLTGENFSKAREMSAEDIIELLLDTDE